MRLKPDQLPALAHEERVQRLQQLTADLARAVDLAEEQRRILRDLTRDATQLADSMTTPSQPSARPIDPVRRPRKR